MTVTDNQDDLTIPRSAGTYALVLKMRAERSIQVGKLGMFEFPAGYYVYTGSAFGPGGLGGRLGRHMAPARSDSPLHWHIDYLRRWAPVVELWFAEHSMPREHAWAAQVGEMAGSGCPAPRFGASDCRCRSHLFHFEQIPAGKQLSASLARLFPNDRPLKIVRMERKKKLIKGHFRR